jgi:pimeloyl-ACP methyl ester carboxylesterase
LIHPLSLIALAMLVLSACSRAPPIDVPAAARDRVTASGWVVAPDDVRIRYHHSGSGPVTLVFVHGWLCDSRYWRLQEPEFSSRYEVITVDLAGHGESGFGREAWTLPAFGQDVATVVRAAASHDVVLIGHSMGGAVIVEAAHVLGKRVIGLVAVDSLRQDFFEPHLPEGYREDFTRMTRELVAATMFVPESDPVLRDAIVADMSQGPEYVGLAIFGALPGYDLAASLAQLTVPLVLINSDYLPTDVARIEAATRELGFETMSGAGHFVMLEQPMQFNELLESTLARLRATS